ncbi:phytanoyl-CoA dioxygenase family protein [Candidatus Marinimicrobia bacterium]|nr:phytanoyl-CoA dioxygenase family protein [Candidatus Neomarinimicrobiota bacterium]
MIDDFSKDGYYLKKTIFSKNLIDLYESEFDKIVHQLKKSREDINARWGSKLTSNIEPDDSLVIHTHNVQSYSSILLQMIQNNSFLDEVEKIIGPNIILHHTKLFEKPPIIGAAFPLHQDWSYFPTRNNSMIAAVIHLSKSNEDMGCLRIVPKSHQLGKIKNSDGHRYNVKIHNKYKLEDAIPIEANPGDVLFFHCCSLHGSMSNLSTKTRKSILVQLYSGQDEVEEGNNHTNAQLVLRGFNYSSTRSSVDVKI